MARPKRGNFATGAEGQARYRKAVQEWLKNKKAATEKANKITSTQKNIDKQKKPTVKKPKAKPVKELTKKKATSATKKTSTPKKTTTTKQTVKPKTVKKTVTTPSTKKVAKQVVKKKEILTPKQKLQIQKGVKTAVDTTKKVAGSGVKKGKELVKNTKAKAKPYQESLKKYKGKKPETKLQRWAKAGNDQLKKAGKYTRKQVLPKAGKDLLKIGKNLVNPKNFGKNVSGLKGTGWSIAANMAANALTDRVMKPSNMSWDDWKKYKKKSEEDRNVFNMAKRTAKGVRNVATGKNWFENNRSHREQKRYENNQKKRKEQANKTDISNKSKNLKINKSEDYFGNNKKNNKTSSKTSNNSKPIVRSVGKTDYNIATEGGKKAYEKALHINKSLPSSDDGKYVKAPKKRLTGREKLRQKNIDRFGKPHVDKLRQKNKDFQAMKRKKMSKEEFRKKYPNSITAQRHKGLRK